MNWWGEKDGTPLNPWDDMATVKFINPNLYGDGSLLYNGTDGPVSSLRLETIRDGIDDFEYFVSGGKIIWARKNVGTRFTNCYKPNSIYDGSGASYAVLSKFGTND